MKKLFLFLAAACVSFTAAADEGMWLLPYLQKMNIKQMRSEGCRLSAEDIYSINHASLKDAVVIFGGGCTGEIVSPEGLLFTNHHCGYGSIQQLSSVEHDYLTNGFWAMSRAEEIPVPGLQVRFIRSIEDVTAQILGTLSDTSNREEYDRVVREKTQKLTASMQAENPDKEIQIKPFFGGNQFFAFVIEVYTDVRLVGTPPTSIGKFGGDTDNWMWPRHTGDFSVFRVYAGAENRPAEYAPENRPYRAEKFLTVSLADYKEGDFAMAMGFPGSTKRYATSCEIENLLNVTNPNRIFIRGERLAILREDMVASDKVRIQYAAKYAASSNYWKNSIGMSRGLERLNVVARKQAQERAFQTWADQNTQPDQGYIGALPEICDAVAAQEQTGSDLQWIGEAFVGSIELMTPQRFFAAAEKSGKIDDPDALKERVAAWYKDYNAPTDRKVAKRMLQIARENMHTLPSVYAEVIDSLFAGNSDAYVDYLFDNSLFASDEGARALIDDFSVERYKADPAVVLAASVMAEARALSASMAPSGRQLAEGARKYIAGLMLENPTKAWAPDANFTIRLTYGRILPYDPADGIHYNYYTTLKGVMEKENPENPTEFTVPAKLKELYAAHDFGRYANAAGELQTDFLADCDITGGNSGSPVMNARGELIGLAFDGNWEAMSGDIAFEPALQRMIAVDIRYVLFVIDKFAGAGWLLDEMTIK